MIENIKGIVEKKTPAYVVMNANGIGIKISMSINGLEAVPPKGNDAVILTYLHVREDMLDLYGFSTERERHTFMQLINISGIGPKLALTILSGINPDKLKDRVVAGDVASLTSVPGVGAKTAKQIRRSAFLRVYQVPEFWLENGRYRNPLSQPLFPVYRRLPVDHRDGPLPDRGR